MLLCVKFEKMCFWYVFEKELTGKDFMKKIYWEPGIAEKIYWELGILTPPKHPRYWCASLIYYSSCFVAREDVHEFVYQNERCIKGW